MDIERQLLFLLSAIGAFNGFFLSIYFAFFSKLKQVSNYFLSALILVLSIRIIKSVFLYFNGDLAQIYIQIGIAACALIGPFLFLYINTVSTKKLPKGWISHIMPIVVVITVLAIIYPYWSYRKLWSRWILKGIYLQWLLYILFTGYAIRDTLKKLFSRSMKLTRPEIWVLSIFVGVALIWLGYNIGSYTSYIVGAFSSSFVFYLIILFWVFKRDKKAMFFEEQTKYANKKIESQEAKSIRVNLEEIITSKELFKNPNLKLNEVASQLNVLPHYLSQFLNDNLGKSFSLYINEYRIEEAKRLLKTENNYTTEAIGYECGFNSKSTFFTTFKKITGVTPSKYKLSHS